MSDYNLSSDGVFIAGLTVQGPMNHWSIGADGFGYGAGDTVDGIKLDAAAGADSAGDLQSVPDSQIQDTPDHSWVDFLL